MNLAKTEVDHDPVSSAAVAADIEERKANMVGKFKCKACYVGFSNKSQIDRHRKPKEHKQNEADLKKTLENEVKAKE